MYPSNYSSCGSFSVFKFKAEVTGESAPVMPGPTNGWNFKAMSYTFSLKSCRSFAKKKFQRRSTQRSTETNASWAVLRGSAVWSSAVSFSFPPQTQSRFCGSERAGRTWTRISHWDQERWPNSTSTRTGFVGRPTMELQPLTRQKLTHTDTHARIHTREHTRHKNDSPSFAKRHGRPRRTLFFALAHAQWEDMARERWESRHERTARCQTRPGCRRISGGMKVRVSASRRCRLGDPHPLTRQPVSSGHY